MTHRAVRTDRAGLWTHLVKDEAELVGTQRPLWWVWFTVGQTRSQTRHGAVVDLSAELQRQKKDAKLKVC